MSHAERLAADLSMSVKLFKKTLETFDEDDSGFAPQPGLFTVAGHVAHAAGTVDWFVDGVFGEGWDMDFEGHLQEAHATTSLADGMTWLDHAYERAIEVIGSASDDELNEPIGDPRIMAGQPRGAIVNGITDHTAHHRGALTVYARLLGKVPVMPYA
ncbi:DinB family protein [Candidatus Palauibacter sp.]|uniref:DinB family protein n=1 Tax=Candidatus Palauibacter sp. TaxID=3101350 RepID=UPI003B029A25